MSGALIIGELLRAATPLPTDLAVDRIKGGLLPAGIELPAIAVTTVSSVPMTPVDLANEPRSWLDRVQVTVLARNWREQGALINFCVAVCGDVVGDIGGFLAVTVLTDNIGPDFTSADSSSSNGQIYMQSVDFRVRLTRPL